MAGRGRAALERRVAALSAALERPRFLLLRVVLRVHGPAQPGQICRCCPSSEHPRGSPHATTVELRVLEEIVVDLGTGERHRRADVSADAWSEFEQIAQAHEIAIRCSEAQVGMLLDDTGRHILAAGGNRSGKTTLGLYWLVLQWIRRGGRERRFWLVASTLPKAHRLLQKLFDGTGETPAILPAVLATHRPATHRAGDLITRMVDGSWIDLRYFEGDPGAERLKSDAIVAALVDEAAHLPTTDSLIALMGRCFDAGGRLFLASTPRPSAMVKAEIVDQATAFERLPPDSVTRIEGRHPGARWRVESLKIPENPWLDPAIVQRDLNAAKPDDPATRRDFFGEWISNSGPLWTDFVVDADDPKLAHVFRHEANCFAEVGPTVRAALGVETHVDVTARAVKFIAGRPSPHVRGLMATNMSFLLGQDVNIHPMSTCVISFSAPPGAADDRDKWHVWVWDVFQTHGHSLEHAEKLASLRFARVLRPNAEASPYEGACIVTDAQSMNRDPTAHRFGADPQGLPQIFGRYRFDMRAPLYKHNTPVSPPRRDSHVLIHRLLQERRLHIRHRCQSLIESFLEQEAGIDGDAPMKTSHDRADRLASPMDALRYALWAAVHGGRAPTVLRQA